MRSVQSRVVPLLLAGVFAFVLAQQLALVVDVSSAEVVARADTVCDIGGCWEAGVSGKAVPALSSHPGIRHADEQATPTAVPTTATPTTTPTATSTVGTVTPVPLGSWVRWPDWPTDGLGYQDVELRDVYFPTLDEGWAVGFASDPPWHDASAIILHYRDGQWSVDRSLSEEKRTDIRLYAIDGISRDDIWAVGKDRERFPPHEIVAAMLHYDGERWTKFDVELVRPPQAGRAVLNDIDMVIGDNGVEGWAISQRSDRGVGYVLHYIDGVWQRQWEVNGQDLLTIDMADATDGWIIGSSRDDIGYWHWYHNGLWVGGSSWTGKMYGVSMADPLYGWTVGPKLSATTYLGVCHDPEQPGCQWYLYSGVRPDGRGIPIDLYDIQLLSRHDGWVVGTHYDVSSAVIHYAQLSRDVTSRSSVDWHLMDVEDDPVKDLYSVYMLPGPAGWAVDGWAVGEDGAILRYEGPALQATETPTPTTIASPTSTPSMTPNPTDTPMATPSATSTPSPTATATASTTPTPSPTPTATPTEDHNWWYVFLPMVTNNGSEQGYTR